MFNKTSLRAKYYSRYVHRDYAAHFFRWGYVLRFVNYKNKVLDVGCGQDIPLSWVLRFNKEHVPKLYVGVDLNKFHGINHKRFVFYQQCNFLESFKEIISKHGLFDRVVCLEVIEHMQKSDGLKLIQALKASCVDNGLIIISTPVFNGRNQSKNHIHEWTISELNDALKEANLKILKRFGTFANIVEIRKVLSDNEKEIFDKLSSYYGHEVISCFLAPLYPDVARNNIWVCEK